MNIRQDIQQLKTGTRELRKFGLGVGAVFAVLGLWFLFRSKAHWPFFLWPGMVLLVFGAVWPRSLKWVYVAWMGMAFVLGAVLAYIILTLLFLFVVTPVGLIARLSGKDFLNLALKRQARSYWIHREVKTQPPVNYERQF